MNLQNLYQKIGFLRLSLLIMLIYGFVQIHVGEKVGLRNGRGWDGVTYAFYVQHFDSLWDNGMLNKVHLLTSDTIPLTEKNNRFLASMLVHYSMRALDKPLEPTGIVRTFEYHNLIWALLAVLAWHFIAKKFAFREADKWLGLALMFGNFAFLKNNFYNPINTDMIAYCLIIIQLAFFFYRFHVGIILTGFLGALVWQPITIYAYLMLLFPVDNPIIKTTNKAWIWNTLVVFLVGFIFGFGFWNDWQVAQKSGDIETVFSRGLVGVFGQSPVNMKYFYVSVILAFFFTLFYFRILVRNIHFIETFKSISPKKILSGLLYCIMLLGAVKLSNLLFSPQTQEVTSGAMTNILTNSTSNPFLVFVQFIYNTYAFHKPLEFYVAHITFFGLGFLIVGIYFHAFSQKVRKQGGMAILIIFVVSYANSILNPQSRIGTALAPFVLLYSILIIKDFQLKTGHYWVLFFLNVIISKIWYPIGDFIHNFDESYARYYMNWGTWMNLRMLIVQGAGFIFISIYLIGLRPKQWRDKIRTLMR